MGCHRFHGVLSLYWGITCTLIYNCLHLFLCIFLFYIFLWLLTFMPTIIIHSTNHSGHFPHTFVRYFWKNPFLKKSPYFIQINPILSIHPWIFSKFWIFCQPCQPTSKNSIKWDNFYKNCSIWLRFGMQISFTPLYHPEKFQRGRSIILPTSPTNLKADL